MKTIAALIILLVLGSCFGTASAQEYSVRVTHNTNLRASYSLRSAIVETVGAGTILDVMRQFNRWLNISRDGQDVWLADWVPMTRVEIETPRAVDNCCYVDRQCSAEDEWEAGYWAFQHNECPAPARAQPQTPAQTEASSPESDPSNVDNCCFLNWQCYSDYDWQVGYETHQQNQCESRSGPSEAPKDFGSKISAALNMLRVRASHWYHYTVGALTNIQEVSGNKIRVNNRTGETSWGAGTHIVQYGSVESVAALLVHEACHVQRRRAGKEPGGVAGEAACLGMEIEVLKLLGGYGSRLPYLETLRANIRNPAYQWWHD